MLRGNRPIRFVWLCLLLVAAAASAATAGGGEALMLILDGSGSMWGHVDDENKIVIARRVLRELVEGLPDDREVGLVAYGHRTKGECDDIETVVALGALDKAALTGRIDALHPKGKTPITKAVVAAIDQLQGRDGPASVILLTDGLETCEGDPCEAVRAAKEAGVDFVMHVIGFAVGKEDVSQLECMAQAGEGRYVDADSADELGLALEQAVAAEAELPPGRLSIRAVADGELTDVAIQVRDAATGKAAGGGRTYTSSDTNPRVIPLPDGTFDVEVAATRIRGGAVRNFRVEIAGGGTVEKVVDFSTGELAVGVSSNGELSDATVKIFPAGTTVQQAAGRTYTASSSNPAVFRLTAGEYDVEVRSVSIKPGPTRRFENVVVEPQGRVELSHDFPSGTLRVGAVAGAELVDATVNVVDVESGKAVAARRTYTADTSNPAGFLIPPGRYRVRVQAVRHEGRPREEFEITVEQGKTVEHTVEFGS